MGVFPSPPLQVHFLAFLRRALAFCVSAWAGGVSGVAGGGVAPCPASSHWTNMGMRARLGVPRWKKSPGCFSPPAERVALAHPAAGAEGEADEEPVPEAGGPLPGPAVKGDSVRLQEVNFPGLQIGFIPGASLPVIEWGGERKWRRGAVW